ncbi:MAG: GH116 family glycosyl hydrolase, partial [Thermoguttaceae bacterium]|nr:GH116 family glycosyl hydrolase [Thermoguttaceae bacterium]
ADPACPVGVRLEAFSPFIPLNPEDSGLPATIIQFTLENRSDQAVQCRLAGWLENAVCKFTGAPKHVTRLVRHGENLILLEHGVEPLPAEATRPARPDILFEDFEKSTYEGWTVEGTAFGAGPIEKKNIPHYQGEVGGLGQRVVNSHATAPGQSVEEKDRHTGRLTSRPFTIERNYIHFWIGGGAHKGRTCLNLLVDGKVVASATGRNDNRMQRQSFDVRPWAGKQAQLQIVDQASEGWGNIGLDHIVFSDKPVEPQLPLPQRPDYGTMALAVVGQPVQNVQAVEELPDGSLPEAIFASLIQSAGGEASVPTDQGNPPPRLPATRSVPSEASPPAPTAAQSPSKPSPKEAQLPPKAEPSAGGQTGSGRTPPCSALVSEICLEPGQSKTVTFLVAWYFPNLRLDRLPPGRWYGKRFGSASQVAQYITDNFDRLTSQTRLWRDTWYDSTLPYWFLDRTFANTSILASSTCHWLANGRFYGWEGVGCCPGTCTHVWQYAQAVARLFPQLERSARQMTDYGVAFDGETGMIAFRAEHNRHWAADGQAGCILRAYREHLMSTDDGFLRGIWPRVKKSLEFLMNRDSDGDGILDGPQHNTLDADWYGQVAWLSGMYLAALRAGEEMALRMDDPQFAKKCRELFEHGQKNIDGKLFNGQYYVHLADPAHPDVVGSYNGCHIDQVLGQSWAWQLGLGRILDAEHVRSALRSIWRYNLTLDVGPYRAVHKPGRWYAMPGEGGVLMCTWPLLPVQRVQKSYDYYFNECMNGFEYQLAWHMIAEGMVEEGLAITRLVHDRYHPAKRNPWNEVECGDHYARSMASYGVFLAICGYHYEGPRGLLAFAPRLHPENFRAAFTTAEGWGTYSQKLQPDGLHVQLQLRWGRLKLQTLTLSPVGKQHPQRVEVWRTPHQIIPAELKVQPDQVHIHLTQPVLLEAGQALSVRLW